MKRAIPGLALALVIGLAGSAALAQGYDNGFGYQGNGGQPLGAGTSLQPRMPEPSYNPPPIPTYGAGPYVATHPQTYPDTRMPAQSYPSVNPCTTVGPGDRYAPRC